MKPRNEKIVLIGSSSLISLNYAKIAVLNGKEVVEYSSKSHDPSFRFDALNTDHSMLHKVAATPARHYLINIGLLKSKTLLDQSIDEALNSMQVNVVVPVKLIELIIKSNEDANILVIGSESGKKGSYDTSYFLSKAAFAKYVEERRLRHPKQRLNMVSPSTIADSAMTTNRKDTNRLDEYRNSHPKKRFLTAKEVAKFIYDIHINASDYLCNANISLDGGKFTRMGT